jgi:hypothetical protein
MEDRNKRLNKLQTLLEVNRQHMLGLDWQSKLEFKEIEKKIIAEIKSLMQNRSVVK